MNPLKRGLLDTFKIVKQNKLLFVGLMIVQFLFLLAVFFVAVNYQIKIYDSLNTVLGPLQTANYNATALEAGQPFLPDMANMGLMMKSYDQMIKNIFQMLFLILGCFLFFNGFLWSVANYLVKHDFKSKVEHKIKSNSLKTTKIILNYWKNFVLVSLVFLIPVGLISYFVLINLISDNKLFQGGFESIKIVLLVVSYFMLVGFCLINLKLKKIFKKLFWIGIMQAHWMLIGLMGVLSLLFLSLLLIYFFTTSLFMMTLGIVLTLIVLVLGKLFLVGVVRNVK